MISLTLHLLACVALAVAALYWRQHTPEGQSIYRQMLPFVIASGFLGLVILYRYIMELFVASYSGSIYDGGTMTRGQITWLVISACLMLVPLAGLIPSIGRQPHLLLFAACLAALPSVVALVIRISDH